jgi:hypothetical protein
VRLVSSTPKSPNTRPRTRSPSPLSTYPYAPSLTGSEPVSDDDILFERASSSGRTSTEGAFGTNGTERKERTVFEVADTLLSMSVDTLRAREWAAVYGLVRRDLWVYGKALHWLDLADEGREEVS